ncbi:peptidoglycan recognition protein family protein [Clostridium lundense]|uniref:peptidoglycan recognition protein family protein n=1 Tax=Clostridium lundense TaxID=319475 RepID=UPI0004854D05|nr:N-acetylmuramoyl-L-alanine amidase [Clostridium lundense]
MNIINTDLKFNGLTYCNSPRKVILHHAEAVSCSIEDIHNWHLNNGWSGCGYHYLVRKNGVIYKGRGEKALDAHCINYNAISIGICVEGSYNFETMPDIQYNALIELIRCICNKYNITEIYGHRELNATDCPGKNFPLDRIRREVRSGAAPKDCTSYPGYLLIMNPSVKDNNVRLIQKKLIEKGYSVGSCGADGYFGYGTLEAVKRFQRDKGLVMDGIVGERTWRKIMQ